MKRNERLKRKIDNFMFDHYVLKNILHEGKTFFLALFAAFIFAFGYVCFITPLDSNGIRIVTGGVSGISQIFVKILEMCGIILPDLIIDAIGYTCFNLPLIIFAFFKVGKKFSIYTAINVFASSLLVAFMPKWGFIQQIKTSEILINSGMTLRIIFASITVGISSALAFAGEISCGGIDLITYYISMKKSTSTGKYNVLINTLIVVTYTVLLVIESGINGNIDLGYPILSIFISVVYFVISALIIDMIHIRNKKVQLQIITSNVYMTKVLISHFPHSLTSVSGKGGYSGAEKDVLFMNVSSIEVKKVVSVIRQVDSKAFISVTPLSQVYGNFFIKPIE